MKDFSLAHGLSVVRYNPHVLIAACMVMVAISSVANLENPRATDSWITDQAEVLSEEEERTIDALANTLNAEIGIELAVVTVDDVSGTPKSFATELFNHWGIGQADTNNGVLVLLVMGKRRLEIETGTGLDPVLKASWLKDMQEKKMVPLFKGRDFGGGLVAGVRAIDTKLRSGPSELDPEAADTEGDYVGDPMPSSRQDLPSPNAGRVRTTETPSEGAPDDGTPWIPLGGGAALLLGGGIFARRKIRRMRRTCKKCQLLMFELDEVADDSRLTPGQRTEERIGSVDYDVYICRQCQEAWSFANSKWFSGYSRCTSCGHKTLSSASKTLVSATYDHGGEVQVTESCAHCSHTHSYTRYTARLTQNDDSSYSSSSSFGSSGGSFGGSSGGGGGGSFGGGSSSGGGAGSSW